MYRLTGVDDSPKQIITKSLPDGTKVILSISYKPMQKGWFIDSLIYGTFTINCLRISNGFNILRQFKNKLKFGLACFSDSDVEPGEQTSFSNGSSKLFILDSEEVQKYEDFLSGK